MAINSIFNYIKSTKFFADYAPGIPAWKKKISGKNSNGNPVDFTEKEKGLIQAGLKQLVKDASK